MLGASDGRDETVHIAANQAKGVSVHDCYPRSEGGSSVTVGNAMLGYATGLRSVLG